MSKTREPSPSDPSVRLDRNLAALAAHSPAVAERLRAVTPRSDVRLMATPSGELTARVGEVTLHSTYDPVREAARLVALEVTAGTTACVILGLGLGYHAEEVLRSHPGLPLAVVEPDLPLLVAALRARDLTRLLSSPDVLLLLAATPEEVAGAVEALPLRDCALLATASARALDPDYYGRAHAAVLATADRKQINVNTVARFGRIWVRNLLGNVASLVSSPGVSSLVGGFHGLPALVVAAGPTLDAVEPLLPDLHRRMVILAVDSSLGSCLRQGIEPDFVVTVDPQYWNTRYFDRLRAPSSLLVCEPSTNPASLRRLGLPAFFSSSLFPLGKLIEGVTGEKGKVGAGGSVATSAWDVARLMGCSPIYLAGLDLGFPGSRTHARGMHFEELMTMTGSRTQPTETQSYRYLKEAGSLRVPSTAGGLTATDRRMLVYAWWFERQLASPDAPRTLTLSPHGVRIPGIPFSPPEDALRLPEVRDAVRAACDSLRGRRLDPADASRARGAVAEALHALLEDLTGLAACAEDGLRETAALERELSRTGRGSGRGLHARLRALEAVDRRILSRASREMVGFLMQPLINDVVGARGSADAVDSSRRLYREILTSAELHASLVREAVRATRGR